MPKLSAPVADMPASADADVAYWEQQQSRLERDARRLRLVPVLFFLTAIGVGLARAPITIPIALVVLGITVAAMATYMIMVRRQECAAGLNDARRKQREEQKASPTTA